VGLTLTAFSFMAELEHFYNKGFGWFCRQCEKEIAAPGGSSQHSRLMSEGEAEGKNPQLSSIAIARWANESRNILECPRCGVQEWVARD